MFCTECGEQLTLMFKSEEGLVPYCKKCGEYRYPQTSTAVLMIVTNREKNKILLAKHAGQEDFIAFAGYVKKGETAEKTVTREFKEETKLDVVKYRYLSSRYHEQKNVLMLGFVVMAENGEPVPAANELDEVRWFDIEQARETIRHGSIAEAFLKSAITELKRL